MDQRHYAMRAGVSHPIVLPRELLIQILVRWAKKEKKDRTVPRSNLPGLPTGLSTGS